MEPSALLDQLADNGSFAWKAAFARRNVSMMHDDLIMRVGIDLPEEQVDALAKLCEIQKISRAEAVRRALAAMLATQKQGSREQAFGAWTTKRDSSKFVRTLRQEWEK